MKLFFTVIFIHLLLNFTYAADTKDIISPDGKIRVTVEINPGLRYQVTYNNKLLLKSSGINLLLASGISLSGKLGVKKITHRSNSSVIISPVPEKRKNIPDIYNELTIQFKSPFSVIFRVYNDGVAYRFLTHVKDSIIVREELAEFNFEENHPVYFTQVVKRDNADIFHTSFEEPYEFKQLDSLTSAQSLFYSNAHFAQNRS